MEIPKSEPGHWNHTAVVAKKPNILEKNKPRHAEIRNKITSASSSHKSKTPKCYIKIVGSRYNGAFLVSVDPTIDEAIYKTMRETEMRLSHKLKNNLPSARGSASPKSCLSSVFKCFTNSPKLLDFKKKCLVESRGKIEGCAIKNSSKTTLSRPVRANLPKGIKRPKANKDVVEKFKSALSKLNQPKECVGVIPPQARALDYLIPSKKSSQSTKVEGSTDQMKEKRRVQVFKEEIPKTKSLKALRSKENAVQIELGEKSDSNIIESPNIQKEENPSEQLKKVYGLTNVGDILKKPKGPNCKENVEVEPEVATTEVNHPIKLTREVVHIGVQDNERELNSEESTHKRSLEMTIEDDNGKPSLKLSVNDGIGNETKKKEIKKNQARNEAFTLIAEMEDNTQIVKIKYDNDGINNAKLKKELETKKYESTEVQTSEAFFRPMKLPSNFNNIKQFPHHKFKKSQNQYFYGGRNNFQFSKSPNMDTKINRAPYLVYTLSEPQTRSAQVPTDVVSSINNTRNSAFYRLVENQAGCNQVSRKPDENNPNSKRDSLPHESPPKKDFGMSASAVDDFEKVLQNICGPNYYHHSSETSSIDRNEEKMDEESVHVLTRRFKQVTDLSCDQWSQTEKLNIKIMGEGCHNNDSHALQGESSLDQINSGCFNHHPDMIIPYRKSRTVHSCTQSNITFRNGMRSLFSETSVRSRNRSPVLEELDKARNEFLSKFKSYQNDTQVQNNPKLCCYNQNTDQSRLNIGDGFKEGINNHRDLSFEIGARELDEGFYLKRSEKAVSKSERGDTSRGERMNNSFYHESQMSVINMTLCNGLHRGVPGRQIDSEDVEETFKRNPPEVFQKNKNFRSNKIKSRSCQNISVSCDVNSKPGMIPDVISKTKKQRYQHFTTAGSSVEPEGLRCDTNKKYYLGFERGMEKTEMKGYSGCHQEETNSWHFYDMPPNFRSSFLPRLGLPGNTTVYGSKAHGDHPASGIPMDRLSTLATVDSRSDTGQVLPSNSRVRRERNSPFQRTILAIKSVFRKTVKNFFGKKLTTESSTAEPNESSFNMYDKVVFIPVPLEKKDENMHLSRKKS